MRKNMHVGTHTKQSLAAARFFLATSVTPFSQPPGFAMFSLRSQHSHMGVQVQSDNRAILARLAAKVDAPTGLTVHHSIDLSRKSELAQPNALRTRVSQDLTIAQMASAAELENCRFRPQPNALTRPTVNGS